MEVNGVKVLSQVWSTAGTNETIWVVILLDALKEEFGFQRV